MKNFKKSNTKTSKSKTSKAKTSKSKTSKAKTSKAKTSKTKTSKTKIPEYFCKGMLCFRFFPNNFFLERNCLMTASKNPENITGQVLSNFAIMQSTSFRTTRKPNHFYQNVDFFIKIHFTCQCIMCKEC